MPGMLAGTRYSVILAVNKDPRVSREMRMTAPAKTCFVISPLGRAESETRARANRLLMEIIAPVVSGRSYAYQRGDWFADHKTIEESISRQVFEADLVVADLTDANANVFFELGKGTPGVFHAST